MALVPGMWRSGWDVIVSLLSGHLPLSFPSSSWSPLSSIPGPCNILEDTFPCFCLELHTYYYPLILWPDEATSDLSTTHVSYLQWFVVVRPFSCVVVVAWSFSANLRCGGKCSLCRVYYCLWRLVRGCCEPLSRSLSACEHHTAQIAWMWMKLKLNYEISVKIGDWGPPGPVLICDSITIT